MSENKEDKDSEKTVELNWPPLESDPAIFNEYFHSIGLPQDVYFKEMLSLIDYKEFLILDGPPLGVILNFVRENKSKSSFEEEKNAPYFMKQTDELDNACGLVASLHCFANAKNGNLKFKENSVLDNFFKKAKNLSPLDKAKLLEKDDSFKKAHEKFAQKGQTNIQKEVTKNFVGHYICFMNVNGKLVEFDGMKEAPSIIKENCNDKNFLDEALIEIMRRIENKEIKEQASVMLVVDPDTKLVDLLGGFD